MLVQQHYWVAVVDSTGAVVLLRNLVNGELEVRGVVDAVDESSVEVF